jgi:hypothetical protein
LIVPQCKKVLPLCSDVFPRNGQGGLVFFHQIDAGKPVFQKGREGSHPAVDIRDRQGMVRLFPYGKEVPDKEFQHDAVALEKHPRVHQDIPPQDGHRTL